MVDSKVTFVVVIVVPTAIATWSTTTVGHKVITNTGSTTKLDLSA